MYTDITVIQVETERFAHISVTGMASMLKKSMNFLINIKSKLQK